MRDALNRRAKTFRDLCYPDPVTDEEFFRAVAEERGCVFHSMIAHDDWCLTLKTGNGDDCNCTPTITRYRQKPLT